MKLSNQEIAVYNYLRKISPAWPNALQVATALSMKKHKAEDVLTSLVSKKAAICIGDGYRAKELTW